MDPLALWRRYKDHLCVCPDVGLELDVSRIDFPEGYFREMQPKLDEALAAMKALESGKIANPDEDRMVGHYWLRTPAIAPDTAISDQIEQAIADVKAFAAKVHNGEIAPPTKGQFTDLLIVGIGGSALGPQLVSDALGSKRDKMNLHFFDNTDPDGFDRVIESLGAKIKSTLVVVISKSGGTKETRNGMVEIEHAYQAKGLDFAQFAVAVTGEGSKLDQHAQAQGWIARFPMWDWVGGRTSVMATVGLLPAALQGIDIDQFLAGASAMDEYTRSQEVKENPAARLALMWYYATNGKGERDMVILPYKDRLLLLSRYLQQLVMESLGKELDLDGNVVNQGIAVYGNKGSTDQHAYVQQLREGLDNFFVTFIVVLQDRQPMAAKKAPMVEDETTSGDYLNGFWQGTRQALTEKGRQSITITLDQVDAHRLGALIAMFERTVGLYATLVNINAYHQPGVEAGKKAAGAVLELQHAVVAHLRETGKPASVEKIADAMGRAQDVEAIHHVLSHLAANKRGVSYSGGKFKAKGN